MRAEKWQNLTNVGEEWAIKVRMVFCDVKSQLISC